MIKMMVTVVFVYTICWLPYNVLIIVSETISERVMMFLYFPLHGLAMSHACYNPIIYCFMNTRFRDGLFALLRTIPFLRKCLSGRSSSRFPHTGIGYATALEFAKRGAKVIVACKEGGVQARDRIIRETRNSNIIEKYIDFSSLKTVRNFVSDILKTEERLDILVNNAAVLKINEELSEDGLDMLMQINYFGPFLLTVLLTGFLKKSAPSRIVNVGSIAAAYAKLNINQIGEHSYRNSKLCTILFTMHLAELLQKHDVTVCSVHPGVVNTNLLQNYNGIRKYCISVAKMYYKNAEEGAQTTIYAATEPGLENYSGRHFEECSVTPTYPTAKRPDLPRRLWHKTVEVLKCEEDVKNI